MVFMPVTTALGGEGPSQAPPVDYVPTRADVVLLIVFVLLALIVSFLCSVAEAVLLSITPSYIAGLKEKQPQQAALLQRLKQEKVDQSLAAILTLNTIAHTVGAIGAGAKATLVFGSAWFGLFSAVMTLLILFLSEIIPKTLGALHWRNLAGPTSLFVRGLIRALYPLIWISERLTKLIAGRRNLPVFSRDEFIALAGIGEQSGQIDQHESGIIRNLFRLRSLKAKDIMTPRTVIVGLPEDMTVTEALAGETQFSRLPLYKVDIDDANCFVLKDDVLLFKAQNRGEAQLKTLKRDIMVVPREMPISALLETFLDKRQHIALVVDEYGGTNGLVTFEDVVETLLGEEIVDEMDQEEDMQALARRRWEKRAQTLGIKVDEVVNEQTKQGPATDRTTEAH
ncbi:MAG: DUF21 domain-containing protein [Planctomycetes bacterium]|nr:DUF21 domain-containing protein [Planctomycetota bacterium]